MDSEELKQICFNCNFFFPDIDEVIEYGICLDDDEFSPYIEELLDNFNFAVRQDLIDKQKFPGDRHG